MINKPKLLVQGIASGFLLAMVAAGATAADLQVATRDVTQVKLRPAQTNGNGIIVRYKDTSAGARSVAAKLQVFNGASARANLSTVRAANGTSQALTSRHARRLGTGADLIKLSMTLSNAELQRIVAELNKDPLIEYAEVDARMTLIDRSRAEVSPALVPNDPLYNQYQWHLHNATGGINAPAAWDVNTGAGAVVAVLDTGVLPAHPDMQANLLQGYDFISDSDTSRRPTDARVPGALDYGDWEEPGDCGGSPGYDSSWHGTHVSGTVAEMTNNGVGMAGVAHNAKVLPVRVLGKCGGTVSDIADAIVWASGGTVSGIPANANPAEVINMSLGGGGACGTTFQASIDGAVSRGTLVVVAAGNSNANASNYSPASCNNVVAVGATRVTGGKASYSNYGAAVDLSAPGGGGSIDGNPNGYVWQAGSDSPTTPENGAYSYFGMGGTSMASPHVAGVAALVQSALATASRDPLTPAALESLLKETARAFPVSIPSTTPIGTGIVDARAALDKALEEPCNPEEEDCGPEAIELVNKVPVSGLSGGEALYSFTAEAGKVLSIMTYGGTGNVSVYVKFDAEPSADDHDAKSTRAGNSETVRFTAPQVGTYYIKLVGSPTYTGVTLVARQ